MITRLQWLCCYRSVVMNGDGSNVRSTGCHSNCSDNCYGMIARCSKVTRQLRLSLIHPLPTQILPVNQNCSLKKLNHPIWAPTDSVSFCLH